MTASPLRYDPWHDLAVNWPDVEVVIEPMGGSLLGLLRYPVIALRAGTSAAQRRCTLAHEIVHLERGVGDCGPWSGREELLVHREVARRLIPIAELAGAVRALGDSAVLAELAQALDVDLETARLRLDMLTAGELAQICPTGLDGRPATW
jgi:hypothetical protein